MVRGFERFGFGRTKRSGRLTTTRNQGVPIVYELVFGLPETEPSLSETVRESVNKEAKGLARLIATGIAFVVRRTRHA
eukprot:10229612-Prorocentrum_lima.AAC.1